MLTGSPTLLNHRPTDNLETPAIFGTLISVPIIRSFSRSPSACRISTSAEKSHPLNSVAPPATILNDVLTFSIGGAFLKLHCLFAYNAAQETYQRALIVVQMMSPGRSHRAHFPSAHGISDLLRSKFAAPVTTPTWSPLLLIMFMTDLLSREAPRQRLRLLARDSETNRGLFWRLRDDESARETAGFKSQCNSQEKKRWWFEGAAPDPVRN